MKESISLILFPSNRLGGAEKVLSYIGKHISTNRQVIFVFISKKQDSHWLETEYPQITFSNNREVVGFVKLIFFLLRIRRKYKIDNMYSSLTHLNGLLGFYRAVGILKCNKLICRESTNIFERFKGIKLTRFKLFYTIGYSKIDLLICQTNHMQEQLVNSFKKAKKWKIRVIPNPINLRDAQKKSIEDLEIELPNPSFIFTLGRLIKVKDHKTLIIAYSRLAKDFPNIDLVIGGTGNEDANLRKLIEQLGLTGRIHLIGNLKNPFPYYRKSALNVISSTNEGFPNVLLEMMSVGNRCVSTICTKAILEIPGIYICDISNSEELAATMKQALTEISEKSEINLLRMREFVKSRDIQTFMDKVWYYTNS
ncbi:glycosyltransferase [Sunxiuqinia dokdonensis]|uniref:Glycosyl transferase family 1 domain-containing protein n=1 Tax=Sunxiuqinia dokdonensis TaxID=1409788 RepID=A0A0L8VBF6_9BACT|nr:glycosyltransferase [Sunxiuqinia dokdonensis]KOH45668.1 hypothetical protein NC99_15270 [Sunxiuqinia dokdonensis]